MTREKRTFVAAMLRGAVLGGLVGAAAGAGGAPALGFSFVVDDVRPRGDGW